MTIENRELVRIVTVSNGLRIANFSSPHEFQFVDGSVLGACHVDRSNWLKLDHAEVEHKLPRWTDIELRFEMNDVVRNEIARVDAMIPIDIILVPLPVLECIRREGLTTKCRGIRVADRIKKTIYCDRFCV